MKKKFLRMVAVLLAMSLISGCGSNPTNDDSSSAAVADTAKPSSDAASDTSDKTTATGAAQLKLEPITDTTPCTITIGGLNDVTTSGIENTGIGKKILELTGITVELVDVDGTKLTTLAASGDLPDILYVGDTTGLLTKSLIESGNLIALNDLLETRGQNTLARAETAINHLKAQTDGIAYVIPTGITSLAMDDPQYNGGNGFYTRFDLYSGIGAPEINGMDSFLNTLQQVQQAYPTSPDGKKAYALSAWTDWGIWPYYNILPGLMGYESLVVNQYVNRYTGEWTSSFLDPQSVFWQGIEFYFKANQLGILDPDALTQGWSQLGTKIANGEVYTCCAGNWSVPDKAVCGDEAGLFLLPGSFPVIPGVYTEESELGWGFYNSHAITSACENPERAMDLLNFFDSPEGARLLFNGIMGVDWDYIDGVPQPIGEYLDCLLGLGSTTYISDNGMGCLQYMSAATAWTCPDGYSANLTTSTAYYNLVMQQDKAAQKFVAENNNGDASISYPGKVYAMLGTEDVMHNMTHFAWPSFAGLITVSTEFSKAEANAETYIEGKLGELILAKDQEAFNAAQNKVIEELKAQGLETAEEELVEKLQAAKEQLQSQVVGNTAPLDNGFDISGMNKAP